MSITGVLIGVPCYGARIEMDTAQSIFTASQMLQSMAIPTQLTWQAAADIVEVRNTITTIWYESQQQCSHLLFIDSDMEFSPLLVRDMLALEQPVVGCIYAKRKWPLEIVGRLFPENNKAENVKDGFLNVAGVGGGVLLIHRDAITKMIEKFPDILVGNPQDIAGHPAAESMNDYGVKRMIRPFDRLISPNGLPYAEDMSFCKRWRDCGGKVWANVDHVIGHWGRQCFPLSYKEVLDGKMQFQSIATDGTFLEAAE